MLRFFLTNHHDVSLQQRNHDIKCFNKQIGLLQIDQILDIFANIAVDDPIEELEDDEGDGENDPAVLVQAGRRHAIHLVQILSS